MSGFLSTATVNTLLDHAVGRVTAGAAPSPVYLALCTTVPTVASFGTEVVAPGYGRATMDAASWNDAAFRRISNATAKSFIVTGDYGQVVGWGLFTASTGGTYLGGGVFDQPHILKTSDAFSVPIGGLIFQVEALDVPALSGLSDYTVHSILNHVVGKASWAFTAGGCYVGMCSTLPTDQVPGTEPVGGTYALQNITAAQWDAAAARVIATNTTKTLTAGVDAVIRGFILFDTAARTNYLAWYKLATPVRLAVAETLGVLTGSVITLPIPV